MAKSTKSYEYLGLDAYLASKPEGFVPVGAVQCAHLAARAATSGATDAFAMYSKGALEALKSLAKSKGYTLAVSSADVVGMAKVSETNWPIPADERYLERLVASGRAVDIKPKAKPAAPKGAPKTGPMAPVAQTVTLSPEVLAAITAAVRAARD